VAWTDYLLALPITLLVLFALGILLIDFMLPKEMKWANAVTAFVGVLFSAAGVYKIQMWLAGAGGAPGMLHTMLVDRFSLYFFYLFLAGKRGIPFMLAAVPFHVLYHFYNGVSFSVGVLLHVGRNFRRVLLGTAEQRQPYPGP